MSSVIFIAILTAGTLANAWVSWHFSIKAGRYHGIYRFFSFESILVLVLLCAPVWFTDPLKWNQLISWGLLLGSIPLPIYGFRALRSEGRPIDQLENTTSLVTTGVYRYIRHPLYASLILGGTGVFFKDITVITGMCALANLVALIATAKTEEREMLKKFGKEYEGYMKKSKMFVPFTV